MKETKSRVADHSCRKAMAQSKSNSLSTMATTPSSPHAASEPFNSLRGVPRGASTWFRKLAYVVPISLRYPRSEGTTIVVVPAKAGTQGGRMSEKRPCVYILASKRNGTLYVGVTSDIARRAWQHHSNAVGGFVRNYRVHRLVFVEFHETMADAILREKRIKKWRRTWKLELIERHNRQWRDLYEELA